MSSVTVALLYNYSIRSHKVNSLFLSPTHLSIEVGRLATRISNVINARRHNAIEVANIAALNTVLTYSFDRCCHLLGLKGDSSTYPFFSFLRKCLRNN